MLEGFRSKVGYVEKNPIQAQREREEREVVEAELHYFFALHLELAGF